MRPLVIRCPDGSVLASQAWLATSWRARARGWLGKASVSVGEGLLLRPASSIHSFGMQFAFDLAFLDRQGTVLKLCPGLKPGRVAFGPWRAWLQRRGLQALELPVGSVDAFGLQVGQRLSLEELS